MESNRAPAPIGLMIAFAFLALLVDAIPVVIALRSQPVVIPDATCCEPPCTIITEEGYTAFVVTDEMLGHSYTVDASISDTRFPDGGADAATQMPHPNYWEHPDEPTGPHDPRLTKYSRSQN